MNRLETEDLSCFEALEVKFDGSRAISRPETAQSLRSMAERMFCLRLNHIAASSSFFGGREGVSFKKKEVNKKRGYIYFKSIEQRLSEGNGSR